MQDTINMELPVYAINIDELDADIFGLDFIALTKDPAILVKGFAFSDKKKFVFSKDKQMIVGPAMIPDLKIYRMDEELGEYYVVFTKEQIEILVERFNEKVKDYKINLEHKDIVQSAFINESWIIRDPENDTSKSYGFTDLPSGTWMMSVKVKDTEFWKQLKETDTTGFSVEGVFNLKKVKLNKQNMKLKFTEVTLKDGTKMSSPDEKLVEGSKMFVYDAEGNELPAPDGEYELEDGTIVTISNGAITSLKPVVEATEEPVKEEKMAMTPEDMDMIWTAFMPMIQKMIDDAMNKETVEEEMNAIKEGFTKQIAELKETISNTPASKSIKFMQTSKYTTELEKGINNILKYRK